MSAGNAYGRMLEDLRASGALGGVDASQAAITVLSCLAEGLSGSEARELIDELPGPLAEEARHYAPPPEAPAGRLGCDEFLAAVSVELGVGLSTALQIVSAVFAAAQRHLTPEEVERVAASLREDMAELWRGRPAAEQRH